MRKHATLFARGFTIVTLTSANIGQIAAHHWAGAFLGGFAISFIWWGNSRGAAHSDARFGREAYALGAGCGTLCGMILVRLYYG